MLPLINIVFLLLIFFMIAGALSATAPFELDPPGAASADGTGPPQQGIAIAADGRIAFGGEVVQPDRLTQLARTWKESADRELPLSVRADARADSEALLSVLDSLRAAGIERIRLLAVGEPGGR